MQDNFDRVNNWLRNLDPVDQPALIVGQLPHFWLTSALAQAIPGRRLMVLDGRQPLSQDEITRVFQECAQCQGTLLIQFSPQAGPWLEQALDHWIQDGYLPWQPDLKAPPSMRLLIHSPLSFPGQSKVPLRLQLAA